MVLLTTSEGRFEDVSMHEDHVERERRVVERAAVRRQASEPLVADE